MIDGGAGQGLQHVHFFCAEVEPEQLLQSGPISAVLHQRLGGDEYVAPTVMDEISALQGQGRPHQSDGHVVALLNIRREIGRHGVALVGHKPAKCIGIPVDGLLEVAVQIPVNVIEADQLIFLVQAEDRTEIAGPTHQIPRVDELGFG